MNPEDLSRIKQTPQARAIRRRQIEVSRQDADRYRNKPPAPTEHSTTREARRERRVGDLAAVAKMTELADKHDTKPLKTPGHVLPAWRRDFSGRWRHQT